MDLKKLFVYVRTADYNAFKTAVLDDNTKWGDYSNKIVFLEATNQIWVKGEFYGTDLETLNERIAAIWTAIGVAEADGITAGSYTVNGSTYNYFDLKTWIEALKNYSDDKDAVVQANAYAQSAADATAAQEASYAKAEAEAAAAQANAYAQSAADAKAAQEASYAKAEAEAAAAQANAYAQSAADAKAAQNNAYTYASGLADGIISSYEAADAALEAKLPGVAVSGSGLSLQTSTDDAGKVTYTVVADQSIWEFMGTASAASSTVATVLDGKYGDGEGQVHRAKEAGDVWAVTITDQGNNTVLYAWDGAAWVQIGSAAGVSGVDTTASHGVALTNTASVVGVTVNPGSVADGNADVVTGGAVFTAITDEHALAYAKAESEAATAQTNAYAEAAAKATEAQDNAYAYTKSVGDGIISAYVAADKAINAAKTKSIIIDANDAAYASISNTNDANGYAYTISVNEQGLFNFVSDNIWETYNANA